jgi:hypothetical protein
MRERSCGFFAAPGFRFAPSGLLIFPSPSFPVKGRQNADRRVVKDPHLRMRLASSGTRSPVGVPPRLLLRRPNATAQLQGALPGTWLKHGRYPSPPVPVQRASRRPVIMPAGRFPEAARERGYEPRPRVPLSLRFKDRLEKRPFEERDFAYVTVLVTMSRANYLFGDATLG